MSRALAAAVVLMVSAVGALTDARAASADQQSSVQAQIGALRNELVATGRSVRQLTYAYNSAQAQLGAVTEQLSQDRAQAQQAEVRAAESSTALKEEVLQAYTGGFDGPNRPGLSVPSAAGGSGPTGDPTVRLGYIAILTSRMKDSLDGYRTARLELTTALSAVAAEQRSAQSALASTAQARRNALAQAVTAQDRLVSTEAKLAALEQQAAAARATAVSHAGPAATTPVRAATPFVQGGPVNGGLVALVRSQVGAPPVTAPRPAITPPSTAPPSTGTSTTTTVPLVPVPTTSPPAGSSGSTSAGDGGAGGVWLQLRECESGDDYQASTGNGYFGAYQFSQQTWTGLGLPGRPDLEPPAMQDQAAMTLQAQSGWGQWPACAAALGLT